MTNVNLVSEGQSHNLRQIGIIVKIAYMEKQILQNLISLGVKKGDKIGAAVSGGADSMVLLFCLCELRKQMDISLEAYHFEHGIRGEDSIKDMDFVLRTCEEYGVLCITECEDIPSAAQKKKISVETAARICRYEFLDRQNADYIATAHHMDDMAETVIMNLVRGSGLDGLCGIPEKRGRYIRPMLDISRAQIEKFAKDNNIVYVQDISNDDTSYTRNYIRKQIVPRLEKINENAAANIARTAKLLREDKDCLISAAKAADCIEEKDRAVYIDLKKFAAQDTAVKKRIIRLAVSYSFGLKDLENAHMQSILEIAEKAHSAKSINLKNGLKAVIIYGKLMIGKNTQKRYNHSLKAVDIGKLSFDGVDFKISPHDGQTVFSEGEEYFDADVIKGAVFRHRQKQDFISPLGLNGKKRLSDYLSDRKVPLHKRDELILLARENEVFWVVGVGVSEKSKIRKNSRAVKIKYGEICNGKRH